MMQYSQWNGFRGGEWQRAIDVRSFIQKNYTLYEGDDSFLVPPTDRTRRVWEKCEKLILEEMKKGILDVDTDRISGIDNFEPGYIDKENEVIVGLQTDAPLKRIVNLYGGMRMAKSSLEQYGYQLDPTIERHFSEYRKTHNEGVFDAYPERTRVARHVGLLTGLPDAYGRGRIIGDYRRVALYGIDRLIEEKKNDLKAIDGPMDEERIRLREEVSEQIRALGKVKAMAARYGVDLSQPAKDAHEAVQFLYMAYLAGIKENNGAATSLGRTSTFLDIYIQRDLDAGILDEAGAQELIDQFIIKLRLVRHLRTPEYNELFGGDPTWVTESIGGMGINGKSSGHQEFVPLSAHADQLKSRARTQPDRALERAPAAGLQNLLCQDEHCDRLHPVRERRRDASDLRRRLRHRLLRLGHAGRQADAVLRRTLQHGKEPAVRD